MPYRRVGDPRRRQDCAQSTHNAAADLWLRQGVGISISLRCTHTHSLFTFKLAFPDAMTSISSAAKSQSLQRAPLTRPGPGSTAHPGYWVAH
eukprot:111134-Chlamydomonas_euryale.AAC.1